MAHAPGARIGDYCIDEEVPTRSTEIAYRATHRVLPRRARVVILNPAFVGYWPAELQLMREACILEALHHSGVPRVFECGLVDRRPWIAIEYIDGTTIEEAAAQRPLTSGDALGVVRDAAAILAHAHQRGVVHRNITPTTIVRTPVRGFPICVTEWGDASINDSAVPQTIDPSERFYRAPEVDGEGSCSASGDVFALGAVMFEAATLVLPDPLQKFPGVPAAIHRLLADMLAPRSEDRPTAAEVLSEATRLGELFGDSDGDTAIEEVEVELVDIANASGLPNLGWVPPERIVARSAAVPPERMAAHNGQAIRGLRRRREP